MNIIVTGGAGFIGSNFVFHMLQTYPEYRIVCLDKLTYAGNLSTLEPVMGNAISVSLKLIFATGRQCIGCLRKSIPIWLSILPPSPMWIGLLKIRVSF